MAGLAGADVDADGGQRHPRGQRAGRLQAVAAGDRVLVGVQRRAGPGHRRLHQVGLAGGDVRGQDAARLAVAAAVAREPVGVAPDADAPALHQPRLARGNVLQHQAGRLAAVPAVRGEARAVDLAARPDLLDQPRLAGRDVLDDRAGALVLVAAGRGERGRGAAPQRAGRRSLAQAGAEENRPENGVARALVEVEDGKLEGAAVPLSGAAALRQAIARLDVSAGHDEGEGTRQDDGETTWRWSWRDGTPTRYAAVTRALFRSLAVATGKAHAPPPSGSSPSCRDTAHAWPGRASGSSPAIRGRLPTRT